MQCVTDSASTIGLWASSPVAPDLQLHYSYSYSYSYTTTVACHVPSPSLDKHIWTSVSVRLSLILSQPRPALWTDTELTVGVRRGANWRRWQISDTIFKLPMPSTRSPALLWKSNNFGSAPSFPSSWIVLISAWPPLQALDGLEGGTATHRAGTETYIR